MSTNFKTKMENKGTFFAGLAVMAGLIISGIMIPVAVKVWKDSDRTVTVKGLCEREVAADKVIWPVTIKVAGDDLEKVYAELAGKNAILRQYLLDGGLVKEDISVSVPTVSDKMAMEYSSDRICRYLITSTTTVCTKNVTTVLELMHGIAELGAKGIAPENNWEYRTEFLFEGLNEIKPEMIQEATHNAREAAQKFANDSNSSLGKIKSASQGSFTIENRDSNTPQVKKVRVVTSVVYNLVK